MAQLHILFEGYVNRPDGRVASTVGLVRDGDAIAVIDPGLTPAPPPSSNPWPHMALARRT